MQRISKMKRYLNVNFDSKLYMNQHYIKDEKAVIPIHINKKEEIYSSFDRKHHVLNPEFISYIQQIAYYIPYEYSIVLEFDGISFTKDEKEELVENISNQFGLITHDMEVELQYNSWKALKLFVVGSIILACSFLIRNMNHTEYISEILSIIGTFSIWEFVNTIWFERKTKKVDKINAGQLSTCTVSFLEKDML